MSQAQPLYDFAECCRFFWCTTLPEGCLPVSPSGEIVWCLDLARGVLWCAFGTFVLLGLAVLCSALAVLRSAVLDQGVRRTCVPTLQTALLVLSCGSAQYAVEGRDPMYALPGVVALVLLLGLDRLSAPVELRPRIRAAEALRTDELEDDEDGAEEDYDEPPSPRRPAAAVLPR